MNIRQTLFGLAALCAASSGHALGPVAGYDLATDFSVAQNPNGVWSYGYSSTLGGTFTTFSDSLVAPSGLMTWWNPAIASLGTPSAYYNPTQNLIGPPGSPRYAPGEAGFHPGPDTLAIYRFTAPAAGSYSIDATFFVQDVSPTGTDVHVQRNGSINLYTDRLAYGGSGNVATYSGTVTLASGGTVDFVVGNAGNYFFDSTGIGVQISAVPEPQTYALLAVGLGLVGFAVRRKQRG